MPSFGSLYIVGTPIGNLEDAALRVIRTLKEVDLIAAEDTRVTLKLLSHFGIKKSLMRLVESDQGIERVIEALKGGQNIALVVDAGTPGISDPGERVVEKAVNEGIKVIPIPGPSALTAALSVCGLPFDEFTFLGFPPTKKGRQTFFKSLQNEPKRLLVLYESPYRIIRTLVELKEALGERQVIVARELTKIHEQFFRGNLSEALEHYRRVGGRGEFVIVVAPEGVE